MKKRFFYLGFFLFLFFSYLSYAATENYAGLTINNALYSDKEAYKSIFVKLYEHNNHSMTDIAAKIADDHFECFVTWFRQNESDAVKKRELSFIKVLDNKKIVSFMLFEQLDALGKKIGIHTSLMTQEYTFLYRLLSDFIKAAYPSCEKVFVFTCQHYLGMNKTLENFSFCEDQNLFPDIMLICLD